jgi:hypothetical protein
MMPLPVGYAAGEILEMDLPVHDREGMSSDAAPNPSDLGPDGQFAM